MPAKKAAQIAVIPKPEPKRVGRPAPVEEMVRVTVWLTDRIRREGAKLGKNRKLSLSKLIEHLLTKALEGGLPSLRNIDGFYLPEACVPDFYREKARAVLSAAPFAFNGDKYSNAVVLCWPTDPRPGDTVVTKKGLVTTFSPASPPKDMLGVVINALPVVG